MTTPNSQIQTFDFSHPKLWNPTYIPYLKDDTEFLHFYGGSGSGKSVFVAQKEIVKSFESERVNRKTLVIRQTFITHKDSTYAELLGVIYSWGLGEYFDVTKSPLSIKNKITGVEFIFRGLDDVERLKSIKGVDRVWIEEATELEKIDVLHQLRLRLRGFEKVQITLSYNPVSDQHY